MPQANIATEPAATRDRVRRAMCLLNAARYDEAIGELERLTASTINIDSNPFGWFLPPNGCQTSAIEKLRDAIAGDPENPSSHFQLGIRLAEANRMEEAELRFTQTLSIDRDHADAMACLGLCRESVGDTDGALQLLRRAQAVRPDDVRISLLLTKTARTARDRGAIIDLCAAVSSA